MISRHSLIGLAIGLFVAIPCLALATFFTAAGHGTYAAAKFLFPFTMFAPFFGRSISTPFVIAAFVQFPLYGYVLGSAFGSRRVRWFVLGIAVLHCAATTIAFLGTDEGFS